MNLIVLGASGAVGTRVVHEALRRRHAVTALVRHPSRAAHLPGAAVLACADAGQAGVLATLLAGHDAAISALRPPAGQEPALVDLTRAVLDAGARTGVPLVIVGGAASLRLPDDPDHTVLSKPGFLPEAVRPIAEACDAQRRVVLADTTARWSHLCPPASLVPGPRTGRYRVGEDFLLVDADGQSRISMEDFAVALVDEAERGLGRGRSSAIGW